MSENPFMTLYQLYHSERNLVMLHLSGFNQLIWLTTTRNLWYEKVGHGIFNHINIEPVWHLWHL